MAAKVTGSKPGGTARARTPARQSKPPAAGRSPAAATKPATIRLPGRQPLPDDADAALDPGVFEFEPVHLPGPGERAEEEEVPRVPLFYVGSREYTIPVRVGTEISLAANNLTRKLLMRGTADELVETATMDLVLEKMLGEEGHAALLAYRDLDPAQFGKMLAIVYRIAYGALEVPKDASSG